MTLTCQLACAPPSDLLSYTQTLNPACICRYVDTGGDGSGLYEENIAVKARLVLHFDINKTILMSDRAQAGFFHFTCSDGRIRNTVGIICKSWYPRGSPFIVALWQHGLKP